MTPYDILRKYWGYDDFRPLQLDIIDSILAGHDTLGLMPTGGGKSLTFQVPALLLPGMTVVVTPLISLMKDQVDALKSRDIKAAALFSGMSMRERNLVLDRARLGILKLLYVSPERLGSETFRASLREMNVSLIVVDEAHCISQWGYDFRPSYLRIAVLRETFPDAPILALTASATPVVQKDIVESLKFHPGFRRFALSFHRHNLAYVVRSEDDKEGKLVAALMSVGGSAIVYVRSRRGTARYAKLLEENGISATFYHAGLDPAVKEERQQQWKDGEVRVIVATNAFGMGIDKPDVRVVVHMDVPPSLEEYYQEAGRAGRDGNKAFALTITSTADKAMLTRRLNAAFPPKDFVRQVYEKACVFMDIPVGEGYGHVYEFDPVKFCQTFRFDPASVRGALAILTNAGYIDYNDDPTTRARAMIIIRRDEFYDVVLTSDETTVINIMMRMYTGLFADYVNIGEESIAAATGLGQEEVYQALLSLKRKKIIDYIPKRVLPYIYLPTARELTKHVVISPAVYEERRALMEERINAVRRFMFGNDQCRDRIILEYFGESESEACGMCDVCMECRRQSTTSGSAAKKASKKRMKNVLVERVEHSPGISMTKVLNGLSYDRDKVVKTLRDLIGDGVLNREGNNLYRGDK